MQLTNTEIELPERKVFATAGNFIALSGGRKFYEYALPDIGQFDALHLVVRASGNAKLVVTQFGRPEQDNISSEIQLAPNLARAVTFPKLEFARRIYFECPTALDILGFFGVNPVDVRSYAPAKFRYRTSRTGKSPHFGKYSVVFPAGTTELGLTEDSILTFTAPRVPAVLQIGGEIHHFVGTISTIVPKDVVSVLVTCEEAVECRPQITQAQIVPQVLSNTIVVKNVYSAA